jgi:hypothetical protein
MAGLSVLGLLSPCCCCCGVGLEAGFCCSEDAAGLLGVLDMVLNLSKGMSVRTQYLMELWLRAAITKGVAATIGGYIFGRCLIS